MKCTLNFYVLTLATFQICQSANIAVYVPTPFYSHQTAFKRLWLELAKRGHHITLIQCNAIIEDNENITNVVLSETHDILDRHRFFDRLAEGESIISILFSITSVFIDVLEYQLMHPGIQELLRGEKRVDLLFTEFLMTAGLNLGSKLNVPVITMVSMDATVYGPIAVGNPTHPIMYPDKDLGFTLPLTFRERVSSVLFWISFEVITKLILFPMQEQILKKCIGETAPTEELMKNISLMYTNANPLFNNVRPLGPKTLNIGGGLHLLEPKPLPKVIAFLHVEGPRGICQSNSKDLQEFLDKSEKGVIYFSLGSSITSQQMPERTKKIILKTFSQLQYNVLWKFEEVPAGISENVKIMKWLPQQDVLRHKNIKVFITQGGLQSMEEAIFNYVPMIALPFYGDQLSNANKMVAKGFGLSLKYEKLDKETFKNTILEVINNPQYKEKTKELANLVNDQPMSGLEQAVWWTEYVLRHGRTNHFRNPANDIPWYQFLLLDVIAFFLLIILVLIFVFIKLLQLLKWLICKQYNVHISQKKIKSN